MPNTIIRDTLVGIIAAAALYTTVPILWDGFIVSPVEAQSVSYGGNKARGEQPGKCELLGICKEVVKEPAPDAPAQTPHDETHPTRGTRRAQ